MRLVIVSEKTRYHFQKPLSFFKKIEVVHLYKTTFSDSRMKDKNLIQYHDIPELKEKLRELKPDLIQGLEPYYGYSRLKIPRKVLPIIFATESFCEETNTPYFFHVLENIPPEKKYGWMASKIMKAIAKNYADGASFIFYANNGARKNLLSLGVNPKKIFRSLWGIWGVDINEFKPIKNPQKKLTFIGSISEQKGIMDLISAMSIVNKKIPDIRLDIVGSGPLLDEVKEKIPKLHLEDIISLKGEIESSKIGKFLADSYLLIAPSKELKFSAEQVGLVMIEAQACGVPVISTKSGSIPEFVKDGATGILVEENRPDELATAIINLWKNKKEWIRYSQNARKQVLENFDAAKNARKLEREIMSKMTNKTSNHKHNVHANHKS